MGDEFTWYDTRLSPSPSYLHFNDAIGKSLVPYDELKRCPDEVSIVEFDTGSIRSIVP